MGRDRFGPVAAVAALLPRSALRPRRPDFLAGHRLLRLRAPVPALPVRVPSRLRHPFPRRRLRRLRFRRRHPLSGEDLRAAAARGAPVGPGGPVLSRHRLDLPAQDPRSAVLRRLGGVRGRLRRRQCPGMDLPAARPDVPGRRSGAFRRGQVLEGPPAPARCGRPGGRRHPPGNRPVVAGPELRGRAQRAGARSSLHPPQPSKRRGAAYGLDRIEEQTFAGSDQLTAADISGQPPHHPQHPHLGRAAADADLPAGPGDPPLLPLPRGGRRPLHGGRGVPPGHAVGARDGLRQAAPPGAQLGQRAGCSTPTATASP